MRSLVIIRRVVGFHFSKTLFVARMSLATCAFLGLFPPLGTFGQDATPIDWNGAGIADIAQDVVLVVLKEGVAPDAADEQYFARDRFRNEWKARTPRNEFGRLMQRLGSADGVASLRHLSRKRKHPTGQSRQDKSKHVIRMRINPSKLPLGDAIKKLSSDSAVLQVEPDFLEKAEINDPYSASFGKWGQPYGDQWYLSSVSAMEAWALLSPTAPVAVVAVVDTGVDRTHQDMANVLWTNSKEIANNGVDDDLNGYVDDVYGWNFQSHNNNTLDTYGHGTLVAGLIAAEGGNGFGIAGMAPGVRVMPLRNGESGSSYVSASIEALYYAVNQGANVVNMSFGGTNYSSAFDEAIRYALDNGVVLVASSGNSGEESNTHYPSGYAGVISVGATDEKDHVASFSNYGASVDLVAPGGGGSDFGGRTILGPRSINTAIGTVVDSYCKQP